MIKKIVLLFLIFSSMLLSSEKYIVGNEIIFKSKEESSFKIIKYPPNISRIEREVFGKKFSFTPELAGTYVLEINFSDRSILKEIIVESKEKYKENEIYDIIERAFFKENFDDLKRQIDIIHINNPKNNMLQVYILRYINYLIDKKQKEASYELYKLLSNKYKLSKLDNLEILERMHSLIDMNKLEKLDLKILDKLSKFDERYKIDLHMGSILLNYKVEESLDFLKNHYEIKREKRIAKALATYYLENNMFIESEIYLRAYNLKELLIEYLKRENKKAFIFLYSNALKIEDKKYVDEKLDYLSREKQMENYYEQAMNNYNAQRYQLADLYLTRIINQSKNENLIKKAIQKKAKLYLDDKRYEESLKLFEEYMEKYGTIKDVEVIYSLGIIYYNLKKLEKSDKIFSQIIDFYPGTVWSTRASIYKLQIENKGENNES